MSTRTKLSVTYVSVWDEGRFESEATLDFNTGIVSDIAPSVMEPSDSAIHFHDQIEKDGIVLKVEFITGKYHYRVEDVNAMKLLFQESIKLDSIGEEEIADFLSRQIEDGQIALEDIPKLMARYALADPHEMRQEFLKRVEEEFLKRIEALQADADALGMK